MNLKIVSSLFLFFSGNMISLGEQEREIISQVDVRGNKKVEKDAILTILKTKASDSLDLKKIRKDITTLYDLGYFSDIRVYKKYLETGITVIFELEEKPSIVEISFSGLNEITEDSVKEKLETKLYTIVNEATISHDLRMIEKQYLEKGFYLTNVTYKLEDLGPNEVKLQFMIDEGEKVRVGEVHILGNKYFSDVDIISKLMLRPYSRQMAFGSGSIYQDDFLKRDLEFISYYYKDWGFAEVKIAKPLSFLDEDRKYVRLTFQVEEGIQYKVDQISLAGDLLFTDEELLEAMQLKSGDLFRHSRFIKDVEMLIDKYGDLGYAFVDVNPIPTFNKEKQSVSLKYEITKGEKIYFGEIMIVGNSKTRDNVIRREMAVHDTELYSGTRLNNSKKEIERLGFFEEVQIIKDRDEKETSQLNLKVKVKEKPTGQLQGSVSYSPSQGSSESQLFFQGRYDEQNQSGYGLKTNVSAKWNGQKAFNVELGVTNPRVNDSLWSLGTSAFYSRDVRRIVENIEVQEDKIGGSVTVGRRIIELINASIRYQIANVTQTANDFILDQFKEEGLSSSMIFTLSRNDTNNYIDPTEGTEVYLKQQVTGGPILRGDHEFMESSLEASYYYPVDIGESYRTYFKFHGLVSYIYPLREKPVPYFERYMLGGYMDLRGFDYRSIGPYISILQAPGAPVLPWPKGGDKKMLYQFEYFFPLIQEAGIKALFFYDLGRVFDNSESLSFSDFRKDLGFGFRWITPIAPFRFEFAYPYKDGKLGDMVPVFSIGY